MEKLSAATPGTVSNAKACNSGDLNKPAFSLARECHTLQNRDCFLRKSKKGRAKAFQLWGAVTRCHSKGCEPQEKRSGARPPADLFAAPLLVRSEGDRLLRPETAWARPTDVRECPGTPTQAAARTGSSQRGEAPKGQWPTAEHHDPQGGTVRRPVATGASVATTYQCPPRPPPINQCPPSTAPSQSAPAHHHLQPTSAPVPSRPAQSQPQPVTLFGSD